MRKYIDADKLEKDGWTMQRTYKSSPTEMVYETKKPTDFPAADVVEMRRGKWIMNERGVYECSVCGRVPTQEEKQYDRYCSYCGAKMDGK